MSVLFSPIDINGMQLKNRFVRSATFEAATEPDGEVSPLERKMYSDLAKGEVGLIISGVTCVHDNGRLFDAQNCLASDKAIPGMASLAKAVHDNGGKIATQLFHAGREASSFFPGEGLAPSLLEDDPRFKHNHRAMSEEEIIQVVEAFGDAAGRAREAGFDAVQMHGAHAYIFSQFLSPYTNHRQDQWGGSLENRARFHVEVLKSIRKRVGPDYPVLIKLGVEDGFAGGLQLDDGLEAARILAEAGYDSLEISQGLRGERYHETEWRTKLKTDKDRGYFRHWAEAVKKRTQVPIMAVGGIRDLEMSEEILQKGQADLIALSRPLVSEPGLIARWHQGDTSPARCVSCNKCLDEIENFRPVSCVLDRKKKQEADTD